MAGNYANEIMKRVAAIDIGTNTILMVIAECTAESVFHFLHEEHSIARLGNKVDSNHTILPDSIERVEEILQKYTAIARKFNVNEIVACGTSVFRDAANREEVVEYFYQKFGISIRILSGDEEGRLTYIGALIGWWNSNNDDVAVIDIGGGSTELSFGKGLNYIGSASINIGAVRITERILKSSPPSPSAIEEAIYEINNHLLQLPSLSAKTKFVGVAGTLTTLASYVQKLRSFEKEKVHKFLLTREQVENSFQELKRLSLVELHQIQSINPKRADIIVAGILILRQIMEKYNVSKILVSTQGLRYGIAYEALKL